MKQEERKGMRSLLSVGLILGFLTGCMTQDKVDEYIDDYMERKGTDVVENALDEIIERRSQEQQQPPSVAEMLEDRIEVSYEGAPIKGDEDAPITIVEFADFQCGFCARAKSTTARVLDEYEGKVKLAFRHNPLPMHEDAPLAHKASMAAQKQGKFWEYHDILFQNQNQLGEENLISWAEELGMDIEQFKEDMKREEFEQRIEKDQQFARSNEAGGTPSFFINGVRLVGAQPYERFAEVIDALLEERG